MDDRGNIYKDLNLETGHGENIETGQKKKFTAEEISRLKMLDENQFNEVINMNREQRRKWFKDQK